MHVQLHFFPLNSPLIRCVSEELIGILLIDNSINIDYFERKKVFQSIVYRWRVDTGNHFVSSLIASLQQMTETESRDFDSGLKFRPFFSSFFNKEKGFQIFQNELIVFA